MAKKPAETAPPEPEVQLRALVQIEHDQVTYEPGELLGMSAALAQALIEVGAAELVAEPPPAPAA